MSTLKFQLIVVLLLAMFALAIPSPVFAQKASLVIFPTLIELNDKDRKTTVSIVNKGDARGLYRIYLVDTEMTEKGAVKHLDKDVITEYSLKKIARISPRKMILEPNQKQNVRIAIRKKKDIADGEYRAHLVVRLIEDNVDKKGRPIKPKANKEGISIVPKARYGTAIPIFIRYGKTSYISTLSDAALSYKNDKPVLDLVINREGNMSVRGTIEVRYLGGEKSDPITLKYYKGVPVYYPTARREVSLPLDLPEGVTLKKGTLHITYSELEKNGGKLIAEMELLL